MSFHDKGRSETRMIQDIHWRIISIMSGHNFLILVACKIGDREYDR